MPGRPSETEIAYHSGFSQRRGFGKEIRSNVGRWRPNWGLLRKGGLPNQVTTDPDQDYNDEMNRRHCFFVNTIKEREVRPGPDNRCWQATDPSSYSPCVPRVTGHGRHKLKGREWTFSWTTRSGLFLL